jgi:uncharacterized membrane protein YfcA
LLVPLLLLAAALVTATLSGVFGMAGGLILMGVLALVLPVRAAFVTHGLLQLTANGWRTILHRRYVRWDIVVFQALGAAAAAVLVAVAAFAPSKLVLYLLMGVVPVVLWIPPAWIRLDAARPVDAVASGFLLTGVNLIAGVAGPLLDVFFVRTALTRHAIVATKAAVQAISHVAKIVVWGGALIGAGRAAGLPPAWFFPLAVPLSILGTVLGGRILERMTDVDFKRWTRWIVTGVGATYLAQAAKLWIGV